jgi:outer membrane protein assembly factor BamE (lipoprotein component of BamABCDE complex)
MQIKSYLKWITTGAVCTTLGACTPTFINHGYIPPQEDLDAVIVGVDTRASVEETVGPPSSGGLLIGSGYYYVRSRKRVFGPSAPKEIERQVVAISFDSAGVVSNIERFGLEDGQVVPLARRITDATVTGKSPLRQLFGNIGQFGGGL